MVCSQKKKLKIYWKTTRAMTIVRHMEFYGEQYRPSDVSLWVNQARCGLTEHWHFSFGGSHSSQFIECVRFSIYGLFFWFFFASLKIGWHVIQTHAIMLMVPNQHFTNSQWALFRKNWPFNWNFLALFSHLFAAEWERDVNIRIIKNFRSFWKISSHELDELIIHLG